MGVVVVASLALGLVSAACPSLACAGSPIPSGDWKVTEVLDYAPVVGLDDSGVERLKGQLIHFDSNRISFAERTCEQPVSTRARRPTASFFRAYRIKAPKGWQRTADQVDVRCSGTDTMGPFLVNGNQMLFVWYGVLVKAYPVEVK